MKLVTALCNAVLFLFTLLVLAVDGPPTKAPYIIFTAIVVLTPALTLFALARERLDRVRKLAALGNVVMLGLFCWAFVDQYPHPDEQGFVAYTVLMVATPILSVVALSRGLRWRASDRSAV